MHIAKEITWGIGKLIENNKGYPGGFDRLPNGKFPEKQEYSEANEKKWLAILAEIREGFQLYIDTYGDFQEWKDGKEPPPAQWIKNADGTSTMVPTPKGFKLVKNKEKIRKFKRAFMLFEKYFEHLWD